MLTTPTAEQAAQRITEALEKGPTPGEWTAKHRGYSFDPEPRFEEVVGQDGDRIKLTGVSLSSGKECEANAIWIAAASPAALRALLAERAEWSDRTAEAQAERDAAREERDELLKDAARWISPKNELPPMGISVPTLTPEKRSTTGWAHSYASWTYDDDDDENSRYDENMFRDRVHFWCKLPPLPISPKHARAALTTKDTQ